MSTNTCPICFGPLETREVAPCADCGHRPEEIHQALSGQHTYDVVRLFGEFSIVLCDFCQADFDSYYPAYFGLKEGSNLDGQANMEFVKRIEDIAIGQDQYCPRCKHRLVFLEFLKECRERNQAREE